MESHHVPASTVPSSPSRTTPVPSGHEQPAQTETKIAGKVDHDRSGKRKPIAEQKITESSEPPPKKARPSPSDIDTVLASLTTTLDSTTFQTLQTLAETMKNPEKKYLFLTGEVEEICPSFIELAKRICHQPSVEPSTSQRSSRSMESASSFLDILFEYVAKY